MRSWTPAQRWAFAAILTLAAALRLYSLQRQPLWCDEYYTWRWVTLPDPISVVLHVLAADIYPPLYQVLTWFTVRVADTLAMLRFWSVLGGTAAAGLVWLIVRRYAPQAALAAGVAAALCPLGLYYSQEAKFYSLFAAAGLWILYEGLRVLEKPEAGWKRLAVAVGLTSYLSFLTPYLLAPLGLVALLLLAGPLRPRGLAVLKGLVVGEILALPMLPFFIKGIATFQQGLDHPRPIPLLPLFTAQNFSLGFWASPLRSSLAALILLFGMLGLWRQRRAAGGWALGLLALFAVLPPALNILSAISKPVYSDRAILACAYAWAGAGVAGLWAWPRGLRWGLYGLFIALQISALSAYYDPSHPTRVDFKPPYQAMKALWKPGETVFHGSIQSLYAFKYEAQHDASGLPNWFEMEAPQLKPNMKGYQALWRQAKGWLEQHGYPVDAGMEKSRIWSPRLEDEALKGVTRLWFVQMDEATQMRVWEPQLNIVRTGYRVYAQDTLDPRELPWIAQQGFRYRLQIPLAPGFSAFLFGRSSSRSAPAPKAKLQI
jgi:hypothetical protein